MTAKSSGDIIRSTTNNMRFEATYFYMDADGMGQSEPASETSSLASFCTSPQTTDRQPSDRLDHLAAITLIVCNPLHN